MLIKNVYFKELTLNAARILTVLIIILPITEAFKLLDQAAAGKIPTVILVTMTIFGTLASFPMILNMSCFLAVVLTLNRYSKDHEFSIWQTSGKSTFTWLKYTAIFALPVAILSGTGSMVITPWAMKKSNEYTIFLAKQSITSALSPGVFRESKDSKQVYYVEKYSLENGYAKNIFAQYLDNSNNLYNINAREATVNNDHGQITLNVLNGSRYQLNNFDKNITQFNFDKASIIIKQTYDPDKDRLDPNSDSLASTAHLYQEASNSNNAQLAWRISVAIMAFTMALLVVPFSIQTSRVQTNYIFIIAPAIYGAYQNIVLLIRGAIFSGKLNSFYWIFTIHIAVVLIAIFMTYIKTKPNGYFRSKNK